MQALNPGLNRPYWRALCPLVLLTLSCFYPLSAWSADMSIYGWAEEVIIYPAELTFRAKLDSGARTSSINAPKIKEFKKGDEKWVRFTIDNNKGDTREMELPLERVVRIREHGGTYQRRPVVKMAICLGDIYKETEVNLVDRSNFAYPLLIGRVYMQDDVLIDSGVTKTRSPECEVPDANE